MSKATANRVQHPVELNFVLHDPVAGPENDLLVVGIAVTDKQQYLPAAVSILGTPLNDPKVPVAAHLAALALRPEIAGQAVSRGPYSFSCAEAGDA